MKTNIYIKQDHLLNELEFTQCCDAVVDIDENCPVCGKEIDFETYNLISKI